MNIDMPRITPHLWFDREAAEAARLYTSVFPDSRIKHSRKIHDTPSGTVDIVTVELSGQEFTLLSAGPLFRFNPSISFLVACRTKEEVTSCWDVLSEGGRELMELGEYPFSERYAWVEDRYGLSWQLMFMGERPITQHITPFLMFVGPQYGKAEEAIRFYGSVFPAVQTGDFMRYGKGEDPEREGTIMYAPFSLAGYAFAAMDSAQLHDFTFNEAISLMVHCRTQEEIDHYWSKLSADPSSEQCGWLKDKFGVSWQIVPVDMARMLGDGDPAKLARVTEAFLKMKKFNIAELEKAYQGK